MTTEGGNFSLLAPWIGGAASTASNIAGGYQSLLAPWIGGAASTTSTPPIPPPVTITGGGIPEDDVVEKAKNYRAYWEYQEAVKKKDEEDRYILTKEIRETEQRLQAKEDRRRESAATAIRLKEYVKQEALRQEEEQDQREIFALEAQLRDLRFEQKLIKERIEREEIALFILLSEPFA